METDSAARLEELQSVLKGADDEFAANLHVTARSLLLYRIAGSSDREAELAFLSQVIAKILEESGRSSDAGQIEGLLTQDVPHKTVGQLFSSTTDVLDTLAPREIYKLLSRLRSEPVHSKPASDYEDTQEMRQTPESHFVPSAQPAIDLQMPRDYGFDSMKAQAAKTEVAEPPANSQPEKIPEAPIEKIQEAPIEKPEAPIESQPEKMQEAPEKIPEASPEVPETETTPPPESMSEENLQRLVEEIQSGNAKIDELTNDLVVTRQRLESFEKSYNQNNERLEVLKKELSRVPRRLDEIEDNLTSIVRDSI